jgi:TctA family transporter
MISHGDFGIFVDRPVSLGLLLVTAVFLIFPLLKLAYRSLRRKPAIAAAEGESR